jgi:probable F420-dependent oxidoreductase
MDIGFIYPQTEFGNDRQAIRDLAQTAEGLGFSHVLAYEHVLGVNPNRQEDWDRPYDFKSSFQSPLLLFSYFAAITEKLGFITGILILPQRQTALVAKQAATLDVLSGGRLRLGIGIGWNKYEYMALSQNFSDRGRRIEEQVSLLRQLWTQPLVDFSGRWHTIPDAGINPLPLQRPIPIWFGGNAEPVLKRAATIGDGWIPNYRRPEDAQPIINRIEGYLELAGRKKSSFGLEARVRFENGNPKSWEKSLNGWQDVGATHVSFNTMQVGLDTPAKHIDALQQFASTMDITNR